MRTSYKKVGILLLALMMVLTVAACDQKTGGSGDEAPAAEDAQKIIVTGLTDEECEVTVGELKKLPAVTKRAEATRASGEKVKLKATGPVLQTLLQEYGKSIKDYNTVRFSAKDGYSIAVPPDVLESRPIILAYQIDGRSLDEENQPVRVVIPGERAMYWVRMLERIDLESEAEQMPIKKIVFLETAVRNLPQEDYEDFDDVDKAIKTQDLAAEYAGDFRPENVLIQASDGLQKNETISNFLSAYIKITGQGAPKFLAPHLPQGMHVRDLLYINYGGTAFLSYEQGAAVFSPRTVGEHTGIALSDIIKQTGLTRAETYRFTGIDGQSVELGVTELGQGLVYQSSSGVLSFTCTGTSADKNVDYLLSIACVEVE